MKYEEHVGVWPIAFVTDFGAWPVRCCSNALATTASFCAIVELPLSMKFVPVLAADPRNKKADVLEYSEAFEHVGLLVNGPPGSAGLPFI